MDRRTVFPFNADAEHPAFTCRVRGERYGRVCDIATGQPAGM